MPRHYYMIDKFKLKFGEPLPGFRFKPGECIVNSNWAEEFRQGKSTLKQFDGLKMVVREVGIDERTKKERPGKRSVRTRLIPLISRFVLPLCHPEYDGSGLGTRHYPGGHETLPLG
jgi:hypothetical protein